MLGTGGIGRSTPLRLLEPGDEVILWYLSLHRAGEVATAGATEHVGTVGTLGKEAGITSLGSDDTLRRVALEEQAVLATRPEIRDIDASASSDPLSARFETRPADL